ncbi:DUF2490 domain-containing protein [uncultured Lutibacter sp.]|uniref:DUF2490 domain-containing protein n=1 Tax=uncultured Lutibacter sp. TaxID=437739 RepID=UPI0026225075|nr:DUF2490 domain-containing protein [uncultured Lutibacter sp.]
MKRVLIICFLIIGINSTVAQTEVLKGNGSWLTFISKIKLSKKVYLTNVTQQRRASFLKHTKAYLVAPSINYTVLKSLSFGAGYLFYKSFPNGVSHASIHKNENRFFQQISLNTNSGKFKIGQRLMFEERFIESINTSVTPNVIDGNKYANRLRYRLRASTNLVKLHNGHYIMGRLSNEVRLRFGGGMTDPDFDQNNFEALLGYKLLRNSTIWTGYGRYYYRKNTTNYVSNDLLHVTLSYNIDVSKKN